MDKKMKKNKAMRAAGALFVATMLSTSVVSGTYAKYITEGSAKDNARVAVFGVKVEAGGKLFDQTYFADNVGEDAHKPAGPSNGVGPADGTISVKSLARYANGDTHLTTKGNVHNVVAPGTKSTPDGLTLSVTGVPEVDVDLVFNFKDTSDIWLGESGVNFYPNMTDGCVFNDTFEEENDLFEVTSAYYPVEFKLNEESIDSLDDVIETIKDKLNQAAEKDGITLDETSGEDSITLHIKAGTDLKELGLEKLKLTWEWKFNNGKDKEDTLLGDLAYDKFDTERHDPKIVAEAISRVSSATGYTDGTRKVISGLIDNDNAPMNSENSTTGKYNLIANLDFSISVTQVD